MLMMVLQLYQLLLLLLLYIPIHSSFTLTNTHLLWMRDWRQDWPIFASTIMLREGERLVICWFVKKIESRVQEQEQDQEEEEDEAPPPNPHELQYVRDIRRVLELLRKKTETCFLARLRHQWRTQANSFMQKPLTLVKILKRLQRDWKLNGIQLLKLSILAWMTNQLWFVLFLISLMCFI